MSKIETPTEEQVFKQEVSDDELEAIAGGAIGKYDIDKHKSWCVKQLYRNIYEGGFPCCAATVEDGSWCDTNDACISHAVVYIDSLKECSKAWR